jgi:threonyl-tRNA synthetase
VQYDFVGPKRFKLTYIDSDGKEKEPIVIHRSSVGALERTMAFLIEHYAGAMPAWLSPVQVAIIPVSDLHLEYARKFEVELKAAGIRVMLDERNERMNQKIRTAQLDKIPYMAIVGEREAAEGKVSVRLRSGEQLPAMPTADFVAAVKKVIADKKMEIKL